MAKYELRRSVANYLQSKQLDNKRLDQLMRLSNNAEENRKPTRLKYLAMAGIFVVVIVVGLLWNTKLTNFSSDFSEAIAEEVARNHLKLKPLEVAGSSLVDVRTYFSELDLTLIKSNVIADRNLELLGGRYCSILGVSAAQLRMQDAATGHVHTVYQAPYKKELFKELPNIQEGQKPIRHYINGVAVDVWVEKGILFSTSTNES